MLIEIKHQQQMQGAGGEEYIPKDAAASVNSIAISKINTLFNKFLNDKAFGMGKDKIEDFIGFIKEDITAKFNETFKDKTEISPEEYRQFVETNFAPLKDEQLFKKYIYQCSATYGVGKVDLAKLGDDIQNDKSRLNKILGKFYSSDGESKYTKRLDKIFEDVGGIVERQTLTKQPEPAVGATLDSKVVAEAEAKKKAAEEELKRLNDEAKKDLRTSKNEKSNGFIGFIMGLLEKFAEGNPMFAGLLGFAEDLLSKDKKDVAEKDDQNAKSGTKTGALDNNARTQDLNDPSANKQTSITSIDLNGINFTKGSVHRPSDIPEYFSPTSNGQGIQRESNLQTVV